MNNQSAWVYVLKDGSQIDSEQCTCFRHKSKSCPVHGKDMNAQIYPRKIVEPETIEESEEE